MFPLGCFPIGKYSGVVVLWRYPLVVPGNPDQLLVVDEPTWQSLTVITTAPAFLLHNNLRNTPFTNDSKSDAIDSRYCDVFALLLLASYSIDHPNAL